MPRWCCARCFRVTTLVAPRGRFQGPGCTTSQLEPPAAAAATAARARAGAAPAAAPGASGGYTRAPGWISADVAGPAAAPGASGGYTRAPGWISADVAGPAAAPGASGGYTRAPGWISADVAGIGWQKKAWASRPWDLLNRFNPGISIGWVVRERGVSMIFSTVRFGASMGIKRCQQGRSVFAGVL